MDNEMLRCKNVKFRTTLENFLSRDKMIICYI